MHLKSIWLNFATAGLKLEKSSADYRRIYLINTLLFIGASIFTFFTIFNLLVTHLYIIAAIDIAGLFFSLATIYQIRKNKKTEIAATVVVMILFVTTLGFMYQENHHDYALFYVAFFPLFAIFLKGIKKGILFTLVYYALFYYMIFQGLQTWEAAAFTTVSFTNIVVVTLGLLLFTFYYELTRKEAFHTIELAHKKEKEQAEVLQLALDELNIYKHNLEEKVQAALVEKREQEQMLIQQSKMASMGEMISAIAHQWKQPLSTTSAIANTLKLDLELNEKVDEPLSEGLDNILNQVRFMSQTITDFTGFFKTSNLAESFTLDKAINDVIVLLGEQLKRHNIKLNKTFPNDPISVRGFRNEFLQVILNIINNAKEAIAESQEKGELDIEKGLIIIEIQETEGEKLMTIADNGGGIPEDVMQRIFDPYFTTKPEDIGTGIGLHMVKMIVEDKMQGTIEVENQGDGAKFTIRFKQ